MILNILKWIGIGILSWFLLGVIKNIFLTLMYTYNPKYKSYVDSINAKEMLKDIEDRKQLEEQLKQNRMALLVQQFTQVSQYYYSYYEKGTMMPDYAFMLDLLTQKIITELGGDYTAFRSQLNELLKGKDIKDGRKQELEDKGIPPIPKDIKPSDFEKRNMSDDDINKLLDEWQRKFKNNKKDDESSEEK